MKDYVVLYRFEGQNPLDAPLPFVCQAEDTIHVEEQMMSYDESAEIVWVYCGHSVDLAFDEYYSVYNYYE
jgi:hypothetical protein